MTEVEQVQQEQLRGDCYRLFAECLYPPDRGRLLRDASCLELADALQALYPATDAAAHAAALHGELSDLGDVDVQVDHAALFLGPFALKAPPYGSVYLEEGRTLIGDTTLAVEASYAAAGLRLTLHEPADHVVAELEFMHYLAALAAQAAERGDHEAAARLARQQHQFLTEHLGAWAPAFCAAITRGAETRFYRVLAESLRAFLAAELRR